jgi:1,4-alpha-glucan branching enzyme
MAQSAPHNGNLVLILHTHLPWVLHHGGWPHGTDWLCEAVAECYIPLLNVFNELLDEGITSKATFDISPVLCEQMEHPDFTDVFVQYCDEKIAGAQADYDYFIHSHHEQFFAPMAKFWEDWYMRRKDEYLHRYNKSIVSGFKKLQDAGTIEVMTCGVTHGYSALLGMDKSVRLQFKAAKENYIKHFGRAPRGTWIPECAYRPGYDWRTYLSSPHHQIPNYRFGIENFVAEQGMEYFVVDEQLTGGGQPIGVLTENGDGKRIIFTHSQEYHHFPWNFDRSPMMLYHVSSHGDLKQQKTAVALTRHQSIAMQVWSGESGYPGDPDYLDFHKKRLPSNLRYWRVTDPKLDMAHKQPYNPDWVLGKIGNQIHHFMHCIEGALGFYKYQMGKEGTMCLPFDTELFGHWWFEGPLFIKALMTAAHHSPYINAVTASEQLNYIKPHEVMRIPEGSWGDGGNHKVWMNNETKWTWIAIYDDEVLFDVLLQKHPVPTMDATMRRIATQALRELLLLQASDWQFLVTTVAARDYAERRFLFHHTDFKKLIDLAYRYAATGELSDEEEHYVETVEARNSCFPELRLEWWNNEPLSEPQPSKTSGKQRTARSKSTNNSASGAAKTVKTVSPATSKTNTRKAAKKQLAAQEPSGTEAQVKSTAASVKSAGKRAGSKQS